MSYLQSTIFTVIHVWSADVHCLILMLVFGLNNVNAISVIDMNHHCASQTGVNFVPRILRRSVVLKFTPLKDMLPPHSTPGTKGGEPSTTKNTTTSDESSKQPTGSPKHYQENHNTEDSFQRLFGAIDKQKQIGKCRIFLKCTRRHCKHFVHIQKQTNGNRDRKPFMLSIFDGKIASIYDLSQRSHIPLHIGSGLDQPEEICRDSNQCQTTRNLVTVSYEALSDHDTWFEPFNITITTFTPVSYPELRCPWSYALCQKRKICIPKTVFCDDHANCGDDDDTDEASCHTDTHPVSHTLETFENVTAPQRLRPINNAEGITNGERRLGDSLLPVLLYTVLATLIASLTVATVMFVRNRRSTHNKRPYRDTGSFRIGECKFA